MWLRYFSETKQIIDTFYKKNRLPFLISVPLIEETDRTHAIKRLLRTHEVARDNFECQIFWTIAILFESASFHESD